MTKDLCPYADQPVKETFSEQTVRLGKDKVWREGCVTGEVSGHDSRNSEVALLEREVKHLEKKAIKLLADVAEKDAAITELVEALRGVSVMIQTKVLTFYEEEPWLQRVVQALAKNT